MATPQISSTFPEGYGDFALESSDGTICYFPSQILSHMSPVFKDMLAFKSDMETRPVKITEPITILELFLVHLDPKLSKPPIEEETIAELLQAAEKYQVDTIIQWFGEESLNQRRRKDGVMNKEFAIVSPFIAFRLAARYNLDETARWSLRELCGRSSQALLAVVQPLGGTLYLEACNVRDTRIKRYASWLGVMSQPRQYYQREPDEFLVDGCYVKACMGCMAKRVEWLFGMMRDVQRRPNWESFIQSYESNSRCCFAWSAFWRDCISQWKEVALRDEAQFLEWPIRPGALKSY